MKVIIHLGFPKTASSTLQFGPLKSLHESNNINLKTWRFKNSKESLNNRPSSRLFKNNQISESYLNFKESIINILSDESFTAPIRLRENNFGQHIIDPLLFPDLIRKQIANKYPDSNLDITWFGVIRNQSSLIQSQYVEEYHWKLYKNIDLLFDDKGDIDLTGYDIYNFGDYINKIKEICDRHNDKFKFLLYEDMIFDQDYYFSSLSDIFLYSKDFFQDEFKKYHINKKNKSLFGTFTKNGNYFVPKMHTIVEETIMKNFFSKNNSLKAYFDISKLEKYGYLR